MAGDGGEAVGRDGLGGGAIALPWPFGRWDRAVVPLRPLDANDIVKGVFATVRRYLGPLYLPLSTLALGSTVVLGGCVWAAWGLIRSLHLHSERMTTTRGIELALAIAVAVVPALLCAVLASAVTTTVCLTVLGHHAVLGRRLTARQAWVEARPHLGRTLGTQLLTLSAVLGVLILSFLPAVVLGLALHSGAAAGFALLLIFPGLAAMVFVGGRLLLATPVVVLEGMTPTAALRRSWQLNRGVFWRTFGISLLPGMVGRAATQLIVGLGSAVAAQYLPAQVLYGPADSKAPVSFGSLVLPLCIVVLSYVVASVVTAPLTPLTLGLLYLDRCFRKENLQTTLHAALWGEVRYGSSVLFPFPPGFPPRPPRRGTTQPADRPLRREEQRPNKGRAMIATGWTLRVSGTSVGMAGNGVLTQGIRAAGVGLLSWLDLLARGAGLVGMTVGMWVFLYGRLLIKRGKRHTVKIIGSFTELVYTRYVLYLRPFAQDAAMFKMPTTLVGGGDPGTAIFLLSGLTQEEYLVRRFGGIGKVIAIGSPCEDLPLPGATRGYLSDDDWQDTVAGLIRGAHVVALAAGRGNGTVWEFTEAAHVMDLKRLVLLVYCDEEEYGDFCESVKAVYANRFGAAEEASVEGLPRQRPLPQLPTFRPKSSYRELSRRKVLLYGGRKRVKALVEWDFPLKGIVVFDEDGVGEFRRFDPAAVPFSSIKRGWLLSRLVKRQLKPVLAELAELPRNQSATEKVRSV
ncbi:hypothetical protein [Streptacidiphilus fuscans]|uniref:DUF7847 domain-containing protein n=1 Tax=Streptacidiphilus fuscans TaxID=2789292 RepID=A0A931AY69_9ACTN|nr:hypothetical protein [Streptacidiphilus fuscans]MBF9066896.1 hypothetical protein [Streptacidiphilus fuscans]